jgi:glycosyltransferase involved in cell wall biosynthesis
MNKICYIIGDLSMGGWPTYLINLATELRGQFAFSFVATENPNIHPKLTELGDTQYFGKHNWDGIGHYLIQEKPDIVQYGNQVEIKDTAITARVPILIERTAGPRSCGLNKKGVTHVIASNNGTINRICQNYDGPLTIIKNGVDVDYYNQVKPNRLHFKPDDFVVCYCARIGGVGQGHEILIKAVLEARKSVDVKLVLIGDKPEHSAEDVRPKLRKLTKPMGNDCVWTGALENPASVIAGADLYVCPATHHGISNSLIEAAALGKPILATDVGQTNEIVKQGVNGVLLPANDVHAMATRIIFMYYNPTRRIEMGVAGKALVNQDFNIKTQAKQYADLYHQLLSELQK